MIDLKKGSETNTGFKLEEKIADLNSFWIAINSNKSIFARHKMYPTAFFFSWNIKLINTWINNGWFYTAYKNK